MTCAVAQIYCYKKKEKKKKKKNEPLYKARVAFTKPVHAARAGIGPPSHNSGALTTEPSVTL